MRNVVFIFFFGFFIGAAASARLTDNKINFKAENDQLKIEPKKGFHLNADAPANAVFDQLEAIYKPHVKSEKMFSFKLVAKAKKAKLNFYVCDDKNTVCEQHQDEISLSSLNRQGENAITKSNLAPAEIANEEKIVSKNGKPTLLVFSAPWCPACLRMETEVYKTALVSAEIKKVNFLKLNSDLPENFELGERFHVKAIPTLILLNEKGEEVFRWIDYQPAKAFAKSLNLEAQKLSNSKESLQREAETGDPEAISALGYMYYNALDFKEAIKWLSLSKEQKDKNLRVSAEISFTQNSAERNKDRIPDYLQALEKGIFLSTLKLDRLRWQIDWLEAKKDLKQESSELNLRAELLLKQLRAMKNQTPASLASDFRESTGGDLSGFELAEVNLMSARLFSFLEDESGKKTSDRAIVAQINQKKLSVARPGEMLIAISYLREAGEKEKVIELYKNLTRKYSTTYVYFEKYSRYLLKEKKFEQSLEQVEKAMIYSIGNEPQLYLLKVRILKELDQKDKALATLEKAMLLKDIEHSKFKATLSQLSKIKNELMVK